MTGDAAAASLIFTGALSADGVGAYRRWYQAEAACAAVAAVCLALALRGKPGLVLALLVVFAAGRPAITQFPLDRERATHWLVAAVAFLSIAVAAVRLKPPEHGTPALGWAMVATLLAARLARRAAFGLGERSFYVAMLDWLALVAARPV